MAFRSNRNALLSLTCVQCGHQFSKKLGDFNKDNVGCPSCGVIYQSEPPLAESIDKMINKSLGDFRKNLRRQGF